MKNTFSVLFYVKKQQKKSGLLPIMGRITVNKQTTQFFTQLEIDPQTTEWDSKTKKINGKGASSLNSQLRNIEARIRTTYQEMFLRGPVLSAEQVKNAFLGIDDSSTTLLSVFQEYKQHQKDMIGKCRSLSTYKRITLVYNRVADFIKVKHHRSDMYAAEIDGSFVDDFSDYLFTTYKVSNNQVQKIMQVFKHVTKICIKKGLLKKDPFSDYKIKFDPVDPNFLTVDELKLIIQKKFSLRSLETTKDLFVFSCFTGLAFVDAMNLKRENITLAENGDMWIKITRQKTNIPSIIPVMDIAKSIIKKYENQNDSYVLRCPAPYGNGTHVCAALTGGRIIAAPFFAKNPISLYSRSDGRETLNRRSAHHKHKIAKGSNPTGGGTAVTNPTSRTGGTELRLFHFWDLSLAPPTNRNTYRSKEPPRRMG